MNKYSQRFKRIREALKMKQKEFATKINVTPSYVSIIESGKRTPSIDLIDKVLELGVTSDYILHGKEPILIKDIEKKEIEFKDTLLAKMNNKDFKEMKEKHKQREDNLKNIDSEKIAEQLIISNNTLNPIFNRLQILIDISKEIPDFFEDLKSMQIIRIMEIIEKYTLEGITDFKLINSEINKNPHYFNFKTYIDNHLDTILNIIYKLEHLTPYERGANPNSLAWQFALSLHEDQQSIDNELDEKPPF